MSLDSTVGAGVEYALSLIRSRYEGNANPDNDLPYHSAEHTAGVIRRTGALLRAMGAAGQECRLGLLAAAFHDTVQCWEANPTSEGQVMRRRLTVQNEAHSAAEAVDWMRRAGCFDEQDSALVTQAILATIPGWAAEHNTVSQPRLSAAAPPAVRAVALADLGSAGMDGAAFVAGGDQLFREENLDIGRALRHCATRCDLGRAVLEGYKARALVWARFQATFARGRRARLPTELGDLRGAARAAVQALFCRFEEAIAAAEEAVRVREALPAWEVLRATGYSIPLVREPARATAGMPGRDMGTMRSGDDGAPRAA
jgi:hypothetical protein